MSIDDEPDLRDQLMQVLEENGTLQKLRAQLRATVFLALEDHPNTKKKVHLRSPKAEKFLESKDGKKCAALVYDLLQHLNLTASLSVLNQEAGITSEITSELPTGLSSSAGGPALLSLLNSNSTPSVSKSKETKNTKTIEDNKEVSQLDSMDSKFFGKQPSDWAAGVSAEPLSSSPVTKPKGKDKEPPPSVTTKNNAGSSSMLGDLPQLNSKKTLPSLDKQGVSTGGSGDFLNLFNDSLEQKEPEESSESEYEPIHSNRMEPLSNKKPIEKPSTEPVVNKKPFEKQPAVEEAPKKPTKTPFKLSSPRGRRDVSDVSESSVSEDIAENLEIDDLLNSGRSGTSF